LEAVEALDGRHLGPAERTHAADHDVSVQDFTLAARRLYRDVPSLAAGVVGSTGGRGLEAGVLPEPQRVDNVAQVRTHLFAGGEVVRPVVGREREGVVV